MRAQFDHGAHNGEYELKQSAQSETMTDTPSGITTIPACSPT